jgi:hypothetical protein
MWQKLQRAALPVNTSVAISKMDLFGLPLK